MPSNSAGAYELPSSYFVQNGDTILPVQHNPPLEDLAAGMTARVMRDGRSVMTGALQMGDNLITGMADGVALTDAATLGQVQNYQGLAGLSFTLEADETAPPSEGGIKVDDFADLSAATKLYISATTNADIDFSDTLLDLAPGSKTVKNRIMLTVNGMDCSWLVDGATDYTGEATPYVELDVSGHDGATELDAATAQLNIEWSGADGEQGDPGADGSDGADGQGVPAGGTTGQVLAKASGTDFDTEWADDNVTIPAVEAGGDADANRVAIQAAIDAVSASGGIVELPAGEFEVTEDGSTTVAIQMKSNVWLRGVGKYTSILKLADGQNDCHVINAAGADGTPLEGARISALTVDGNRANNTGSGHCIRGQWLTDVNIHDVHLRNSCYYGVGLQGGTLKNVLIERIHTKDTGSEGIDIKNLEDNNENIEILHNKVEGHGQDTSNSGQSGIDTRGPCKIIGNTVLDGGPAASLTGIRMREGELLGASGLGAHYSICSNNYVDLGALAGAVSYAFNATRCVGTGNIAKRGTLGFVINQADVLLSDALAQGCSADGFTLNLSGLTTDGDNSGLSNCKALDCGGDGLQIEGDSAVVMGFSARGNTGYGVNVVSGATDNMIIGLSGDNNTAGLFIDAGTGTSYISAAQAQVMLSAASGEFSHKIRGDDGEGFEIRSGHTGENSVDLETERPVMQFLTNGQLAFFIGSTTRLYAGGAEIARVISGGGGRFGIGETSADYKLDVNGTFGFTPGSSVTPIDNGDVVFEFTDDNTLTIKGKGSDGTVRSSTVSLT